MLLFGETGEGKLLCSSVPASRHFAFTVTALLYNNNSTSPTAKHGNPSPTPKFLHTHLHLDISLSPGINQCTISSANSSSKYSQHDNNDY